MANITLRDFYDMVGGNYEDVVGRLIKEDRIVKYLNKFKDSSDYDQMIEAIENKAWETVFRISHNLKGMCQNLGLDSLARVSSDLCEQVRHGAPAVDISTYVEAVADEYAKNIGAIHFLH